MQQVLTADGQEPGDANAGGAGPAELKFATPRRRGWLRTSVGPASVASALGLSLLALLSNRPADAPHVPPAIMRPYIVDNSLAPLFRIVRAGRTQYVARAREPDGSRKDTLALGEWDADALFLRVGVQQPAGDPASLFVVLATQSAELGAAVVRMARPENFTGAGGRVEWAEATLSSSGVARSCISFRLLPVGRIFGLACGPAHGKLDEARLACLVEGLALTPAGEEAGLAADLPKTQPSQVRAGCES